MDAPVLYSGGGYEVTATLLRTPRKSYALRQIEYVSVHRPLLAFAGLPAAGSIGLALAFWRYLYTVEIAAMTLISLTVLIAAFLFGVMRVHSLALRDDEVAMNFGLVTRLRAVRAAVEAAMSARNDRRDTAE